MRTRDAVYLNIRIVHYLRIDFNGLNFLCHCENSFIQNVMKEKFEKCKFY